MRAVRYHGDHVVTLDEVPVPTFGPRAILLAPQAVGICGTDTHIIEGKFMSNPPMSLGHEISAVVAEIGSEVTSVSVGDLVTVEPHLYCGVCFNCQTGSLHMCPNRRAHGVHLDGGMQEFLSVPETLAYTVPEGTPAWQAALTEPIACCMHGMDRLELRSGLPIAIFGAGPIGSILTALARLAGMGPVAVIEPRESRRAAAERFGADATFDPSAPGFADAIADFTKGVGFPYVIDAVGLPIVLEQAISIASRAGKVLLFGVADPQATATIRPNEIYAKELSLLGTALNPYTHRRATNLIPRLKLDRLTTGFYPLDDFDGAMRAQVDGTWDKTFLLPQAHL